MRSHPELYLWSAFPFVGTNEIVIGLSFYWTLIGQSLVTVLITLQFTRQLRKLGASESKPLLADNSLATSR